MQKKLTSIFLFEKIVLYLQILFFFAKPSVYGIVVSIC